MPGQPLRILGIGDGRSIIFLRWAWRLCERGHEVHIVSDRLSDRPGELDGIVAHDIRRLGLATRVKAVRSLRFGPAIRKLAQSLDVDLVHAHYLLPYGYWAAWAGVHPLVVSPWNTDIFTYGRERARGRAWVRESVAAGDAFVVSSEANADETVRLGAARSRVHRIVWYADLRPFGPAQRDPELAVRFGWPAESLLVLSLRNWRPNTNLDVLVRAFARVHRELPQSRLILAARGGWIREEIEQLVETLELGDAVAFHFATPEELPELVASCHVAVSLASTDATPASMLECMASGLPLVMGDAITIDEWVCQYQGGEVVPCRDEDAVAVALSKLLGNPLLRETYGQRNIETVRERLGDPGEQLERVYLELLGRSA